MRLKLERMVPRTIRLSLPGNYVVPDKVNPGYEESQIMGLGKGNRKQNKTLLQCCCPRYFQGQKSGAQAVKIYTNQCFAGNPLKD